MCLVHGYQKLPVQFQQSFGNSDDLGSFPWIFREESCSSFTSVSIAALKSKLDSYCSIDQHLDKPMDMILKRVRGTALTSVKEVMTEGLLPLTILPPSIPPYTTLSPHRLFGAN